ncbi:CRISPR-associated endonuclease Cas3'' [Thermogladius sp. 4427co]|uniref:CRISPR-associated endonuclease Cas3'' n=1 Tax=Thermogladius sp. 4427co TaxID=3450718 RepID=UPI003F7A503C
MSLDRVDLSRPYAYYSREGSRVVIEYLDEHLESTACYALKVFGERLRYLRLRHYQYDFVKELLKHSAFLHDIGKASEYYYNRGQVSFGGHQAVSALILYNAAHKSSGSRLDLLRLSAHVTLRHHMAFIDRMTKYDSRMAEYESKRIAERIAKAIRELNIDWISSLLDRGVMKGYVDREVADYILESAKQLKEKLPKENPGQVSIVNNLSIKDLSSEKNIETLLLVRSVTGAVIVADIVVASIHRSGSPRGVAEIWVRELGSRHLQALRECGLGQENAPVP